MSLLLETTTQYDADKYTPLGTVIHNNVESVSLLRSVMASFAAPFGGKNFAIQEAVDRLSNRGMDEFRNKVRSTYPNTVRVVGFNTSIAEAGADDNQTCMVLHISGTCLAPISQSHARPNVNQAAPPALVPGPAPAPAPAPVPVPAAKPSWGGKKSRNMTKKNRNSRRNGF